MAAPKVDPIVAPLLETQQGRDALKLVVKLAKLANSADKAQRRSGVYSPDVVNEEPEMRIDGVSEHLHRRGLRGANPVARVMAGLGGVMTGGAAANIYLISQNMAKTNPNELTTTGALNSSELGGIGVGAEAVGGIAMLSVGAVAVFKDVTHLRAETKAGKYLALSESTRSALDDAGFTNAKADHGIDDLMDAVRADIPATISAMNDANRGASKSSADAFAR